MIDPGVVAAAAFLVAALAGLLPPALGAPVPVVIGLGLAGAGFSPVRVLAPLCAYLVVALARAVRRERAARRRTAASSAAARAAETREAVLGERTRIAGDIHDVVAHTASALLIQLRAVRSLLDDDPVDVQRARAMLDRSIEVARASMHETQTVVSALQGGGPGWAQVRQLAGDVAATSGIRCELVLPHPAPDLDPAAGLALYRTVQEALTNAVRHSAADRILVEVSVGAGRVVATVEDVAGPDAGRPDAGRPDVGRPLAGRPHVVARDVHVREPRPELPSGGHGLTGLRDRVATVGGTLVAGPTATGYLVRLTLPTAR